MSKTYTQQLSEFLADLTYEQLPSSVIEQVKRLTIHTIGVSLAAEPIEQTQNAIRLSEENGGAPQATIWGGHGQKVPAESAAFANGTIADILDWEDCSWTGHPSAGAIPAAFALTEGRKKTGKDYITAVAAAYEGYQRIAMAVQPSPAFYKTRAWGLSSWQIFAASLAAAKVLELDAGKINQTIGASVYAAPGAVGLHAEGKEKSDIYHYAHGTDAYNGVFAAKIAELGFGNGKDYLDGQKGYWSLVSDQVDESWYTKDLGKKWLIEETYIKHWPANMWVQTPLELLDALYKEESFSAEDIVEIRLDPTTSLTRLNYRETAKTTLDAQFNLSFCLAAYLLDQNPSAYWFTKDRLDNEEVLLLADKVKSIGEVKIPTDHFDIFKTGSFPEMTLEIDLKDERKLKKTGRFPKGHPQNNTTLEEERKLFRKIATPVIGAENVEGFLKQIDELENLKTLDQAAGFLTKKTSVI